MPTKFNPGDVEAALLAALPDLIQIGGAVALELKGISSEHFDEDGNLVLRKIAPTVLLYFENEQASEPKEITRTTYESLQTWVLLCFQQSLRSTADERAKTYSLVAQVRDAIGGLRLTLPDGRTMPTKYLGCELYQFDKNGTWYAVRAGVNALAQFSDKPSNNPSNPGG